MRLITHGRNRWVLLTRRWAFKFPSPRCWRDFLCGLLNNMAEGRGWRDHPNRCPAIPVLPGGLLLAMPRVKMMDAAEFELNRQLLPPDTGAEWKPESWGWLDGRPVAVDYGWPA